MTVDQKTYELAEHFMQDYLTKDWQGKREKPTKEDINEFAKFIQRAVEDYLHDEWDEE